MSSNQESDKSGPFPWHIGVYDAHCHPTDTMSCQHKVKTMKVKALTIMATRRQDQVLVADFATKFASLNSTTESCFVIPSFGWHPWFSHQIFDDLDLAGPSLPDKGIHYRKVITPPPESDEFIDELPEVLSLSAILQEARVHLERFPQALVGEVGLDRSFRIPNGGFSEDRQDPNSIETPGSRDGRELSRYRVDMAHQCRILTAQLKLAAELQRPVSVHGVAAHGVLFDALSSMWRERTTPTPLRQDERVSVGHDSESDGKSESQQDLKSPIYPPRICLHSFSGSVEVTKRYLHPTVPLKIFFSFSILVNFSSESKKAAEAIQHLPADRILVESDLHMAGEHLDDLMEEIVRRICSIRSWPLAEGVAQLASNWRCFMFGEQ